MAQPGSALAWGARGRRFESYRSDHFHTVRRRRRNQSRIDFREELPEAPARASPADSVSALRASHEPGSGLSNICYWSGANIGNLLGQCPGLDQVGPPQTNLLAVGLEKPKNFRNTARGRRRETGVNPATTQPGSRMGPARSLRRPVRSAWARIGSRRLRASNFTLIRGPPGLAVRTSKKPGVKKSPGSVSRMTGFENRIIA